jgi:hypothetical protein
MALLAVTVALALSTMTPASAASTSSVPGLRAGSPVSSCLFGGWQRLAPAQTPEARFSNQGACVRHVVRGGAVTSLTAPPGGRVVVSVDPSVGPFCAVTFTLVGVNPGVLYQVRVFTTTGSFITRVLSLPAQGTATAQLVLEQGLISGSVRVFGGGPAIALELPTDSTCD